MNARKTDQDWKKELSPEQYAVTRQGATEPAFTGKYVECHDDGVYRCACCSAELFTSDDKYDSGSGWPSFTRAIDSGRVELEPDHSHGMIRTEVTCKACGAHLGHLFDDGPRPTGQRFCINSCALDLDREVEKS